MSEPGKLYGRRKGHRLTPTRHADGDAASAADADSGDPVPEQLSELFPVPVYDVRLEIGLAAASTFTRGLSRRRTPGSSASSRFSTVWGKSGDRRFRLSAISG